MSLDLDSRTGWPPELRAIADRYPRADWPGHANLGMTARFWLDRHDGFRQLAAALSAGSAELREGRAAPDAFRRWHAPRLEMFLNHLDGHHQVEDMHYFPHFSAVVPALAAGFAVLERDHETIHGGILAVAGAATALLQTDPADDDALRRAADAYADASDGLLGRLDRHLDDEEDLVIPLILDRGEPGLGLG